MSVIDERYAALGGPNGFLGQSVSDEQPTPDGRARVHIYENGAIYWIILDRSGAGMGLDTYEVHGAIWLLYQALEKEPGRAGGATGRQWGFLGLPQSDETGCKDGVGRFNRFGGGWIYWTPETGAQDVHGAILDKWEAYGSERSHLGYPTTGEFGCPDGVGRFNNFQHGSIFWTPQTGAHEVHGAIHQKWSELGRQGGLLGYPTTDESIDARGGPGRFNDFQYGSIYWSPQTGAHEVHGAIREKWIALGGVTSYLGYPTSDEQYWIDEGTNRSGQRNFFQHGEIDWTRAGEAVPWPNQYRFTVSGMWCIVPRSRNEDTDRASLSVAVGDKPAQTVTKDLGDVATSASTYDIDLTLGPVVAPSAEIGVAFNYVIVNAGNAEWDDVDQRLHQAGGKLAEAGAKEATKAIGAAVGAAIGTVILPVIGSAIGAIAGWVAGELVGLLTANCDGAVAVEQAAFKGQQLWDLTAQGPHEFSTIHNGVDSPAGCGSNSWYTVFWTLERA